MARIRLLALDIDGTLLAPDGTIPEANKEALRRAVGRGLVVSLSSGRMTDCIQPFYDQLGIDGPVMAYNGAMVRKSREEGRGIVFHQPLPLSVAREVLEFALKNHYLLNYYVNDVLYCQDDPSLQYYAQIYSDQTGAVYHPTDLRRLADREPSKLIIITDPPERDRLYDWWLARIQGKATLVKTNPEYLEFMAPGVDKGRGLEALAGALGFDLGEVAAVGDGLNDLPMIKKAGLGVAVANAKQEVKEAADLVLREKAEEGAVAQVVSYLGF